MEQTSITDKLIKCFNSLSLSSTKKPSELSIDNNYSQTKPRRNSQRKQIESKNDEPLNREAQILQDVFMEFEAYGHLFLR